MFVVTITEQVPGENGDELNTITRVVDNFEEAFNMLKNAYLNFTLFKSVSIVEVTHSKAV